MGSLTTQWDRLAASLADKPDSYQLVLQEEGAGAKPQLDAELLLRARRAADYPAQACDALLLLLERSMMKEQLAAGLIKAAGSSGSGSGGSGGSNQPAHKQAGGDAAAAEVDPWAKVRPLPPGARVFC